MARLPCTSHHAHTMTRSPSATATATHNHKTTTSSSSSSSSSSPPHHPTTTTTTTPPKPTPQQQQQHLRRILKTIDPYGAHAHAVALQQRLRSRRREALAPDFDVRETASAFYLEGELPGIGDRDAVRLDWIDRRTLSVEATIERVDLEVEWGLLRPIRGMVEGGGAVVKEEDGGGGGGSDAMRMALSSSGTSSSSVSSASSAMSSASSASSMASEHGEDAMAVDDEKDKEDGGDTKMGIEAQPTKPLVREWLSERRVGHYQRTFTFPTDVDASAIRARLGQGLLRVLVPKVVLTGSRARKVDIEDCE